MTYRLPIFREIENVGQNFCQFSDQITENHFRDITKMVEIGLELRHISICNMAERRCHSSLQTSNKHKATTY
jgi:hypothetical protein